MRKTKLENGITLVALIIAIVVLLILAVVSVGTVKNSEIIGHTTNTSDTWKQAEANEASYLEGYEEKIEESFGAKVVKYVEGVPIPSGFECVKEEKDAGLVISDGNSEFVWIPVEDGELPPITGSEPVVATGSSNNVFDAISRNLVEAGMPTGSTSEDFLTQLKNEYNAMAASVAKYKGFYVGRYEVSIGDNEKVQSVANVMPANNMTWYESYALCKTYKTSSVTSSMIWGGQWEAMMNFIGSTEANEEGRISHSLSSPYLTGNGQGEGKYFSSSITYSDVINNIYDLEGNVCELTQELIPSISSRVIRGGDYANNYPPNGRDTSYKPNNRENCFGSRLTLYVEL